MLSITFRAVMSSGAGSVAGGNKGGSIRGLRPKHNWKGLKPVELLTVFIIWKRTKGRDLAQPVWLRSPWKRRHCLIVLLLRSLAPLVCGWKDVESLCLTPVRIIRCVQNLEIKSLSWSETISKGKPFSQYHSLKKTEPNSSAGSVVLVGIIRMSELRRSVIDRIQSKPMSRGRGPMKSIEIESHLSSGMGRG